ncbi:MAG: DNA cytosine methyltransferase [Oligoflexia bacterium]|nr:DNA cytosine methyltransferase [Oligoflexia bacterium]
MNKEKVELNFIDLFAGAGGISCGLEQNPEFKCLLGVEISPSAIKTFAVNHPSAQTFSDDIKKLDRTKLQALLQGKRVDLVVGGPPCQGFSTVGVGNPKDKRNNLFLEFLRIVKELAPSFVLMENVTGLLATKNETTLQTIIQKFNLLGYRLAIKVLQTEKYGVPERRRRTIILGSRINQEVSLPAPTHNTPVTVGEVLQDIKTATGEIFNHDLKNTQIKDSLTLQRIKYIPEGKSIRYRKDEVMYFPRHLHLGLDWEKLKEGRLRQARYQRLDRNSPAPTIMTGAHSYFHPTEDRYLSVREAARIQCFPNHYRFIGNKCDQWLQVGNAVPPLLAKVLGKHILYLHHLATTSINENGLKNPRTKKKFLLIMQTIDELRSKAFIYR